MRRIVGNMAAYRQSQDAAREKAELASSKNKLAKFKADYELYKTGVRFISADNKRFKKYGESLAAAAGGGGSGGGGGTAGAGGVGGSAAASLKAARDLYAPGGAMSKGVEAGIERGRTKAMAQGTQALVSSGLASTSMGASLGKQYEEEVAMPARADLESRRAQAIAGLHSQEAGMQFQSAEAAAGRGFAGSQAELDRSLTREMGSASRGQQLAMAGANRPPLSSMMSQMKPGTRSTSSAPAAPSQHMTGGSGMNSFLTNLQSSDLMKSGGGGWSKGFWE